jgi:hypothetical protein
VISPTQCVPRFDRTDTRGNDIERGGIEESQPRRDADKIRLTRAGD